jgi:hypothetical protein
MSDNKLTLEVLESALDHIKKQHKKYEKEYRKRIIIIPRDAKFTFVKTTGILSIVEDAGLNSTLNTQHSKLTK